MAVAQVEQDLEEDNIREELVKAPIKARSHKRKLVPVKYGIKQFANRNGQSNEIGINVKQQGTWRHPMEMQCSVIESGATGDGHKNPTRIRSD